MSGAALRLLRSSRNRFCVLLFSHCGSQQVCARHVLSLPCALSPGRMTSILGPEVNIMLASLRELKEQLFLQEEYVYPSHPSM